MAEEILRTEGLCKRFGSLEVLRGVSISVFRQEKHVFAVSQLAGAPHLR